MSKPTDSQSTTPSASTNADATMSRSEIESALVGDKVNQKPIKKRIEPNTILDVPPRRQQVLGGDLSGISSRPKSLGHKLTDVSVVNWLVGIIVLAIIGAFFWPQSQPSVTEVPAQQMVEIERDALVEEVESIEEEDSSFSRDNDLVRANDYRQQDAQELQIRSLLSQAQEFVSNRQFTVPKNANAISSYKAVLAIDPKNVAAQQGLGDIKEHFQFKALKALENNNEELARESLRRLGQVETESEESLVVIAAIEQYELKKQLDSFLANASSARKKDQLILPARNNALYYYQQAIEIDPENSTAKKGIKAVADAYIQKANDAILDGDFNRANAHLATVSVIDSQHNSIPLIEAMIARAKPIAEAAAAKERESNNAITAQQDSSNNNESEQLASQASSNSSEQTIAQVTPQQGTGRTPPTQSREQAAIDQRYLESGLDAYYRGEYERAATFLQPLSDKGIARAQFRLGYMHYLGRGFARDRQRADQIIRATLPAIQKFAEQGRAWAQSDLGSLYEDGLVLRRDYGEAVYWYRSAAEQGYPGAQTNLGIMYARGRGVAASRRTAVEWFQRAAKQGDIAARRNLSSMGIN